jgi:histone-lysine N-methyltransferase SETMAR
VHFIAGCMENENFLDRLVTEDEKWILYNNVQRKCSWAECGQPSLPMAKVGLHLEKVMLCVRWDLKGILHYQLLNTNETIIADRYHAQLENMKLATAEKCPAPVNRKGIIFHEDNACPHVAITMLEKLRELKWKILSHPSYSPHLVPLDYQLFRSLQNSLDGRFETSEGLKNHIKMFFNSKPSEFYWRGILHLPERWEKVVREQGQYVFD